MSKIETFNREKTLKYIILFGTVGLYSLASVCAKFAAGFPFLSVGFVLVYGLELFILGIYALLWQQLLKSFSLTVAYANRSLCILWTFLWSVLIFKDTIDLKKIVGVIVVFIGTMIVNRYES
ncbi:MAG: EamA family transporter [Lachnospiraceae bacterium]